MNLNEAYAILELTSDSSEDDVRKRFRELSKKWHPDKNQNNSEAEVKFKEINSAFQRITNPTEREQHQDSPQPDFGGFDFGGFSNPFQRQRHVSQIQIHTTISFEDSILGTKKDIKYVRSIKCNSCAGQGAAKVDTNCKKCGGKGRVIQQQGSTVFVRTCDCAANQKFKKCSACTDGVIETESSVNVHIPGGVSNGVALRLSQMGNYAGSIAHMDQYSDAFLILNVVADPNLTLEEGFVVSDINISLLEALKGTSKKVPTVLGEKEIIIEPLAKNKEEVIIPNVGVNKVGSQRVRINVSYPDNIDALIQHLE